MEFSALFFSKNRQRLSTVLPNSLIILSAHMQMQASADMSFPFRQDSNFWYLTGLNMPDVFLVIDTMRNKSILLIDELSEYQKEWEGDFDRKSTTQQSGITQFLPKTELKNIVKQAQKERMQICYLTPPPEVIEPYGLLANPARRKLEQALSPLLQNDAGKLLDIRLHIARLRQIKQKEEISAIQKAIDITGQTLADVRSKLQSFSTEKDLERAISAGFFERGADGHAYEPIVASGKNASTIHYNTNNQAIESDKLLLLDVGAKVDGYAADISRTWAVGTPTDRQKAVFELVLALQEAAFEMIGKQVVMKEYQLKMEEKARKAAGKIGIKIDRYPHGFSHFLGIDVHDAGDYDAPLPVGSILTVEPGVYLPQEHIGVRIEDNILITDSGIINMSKKIPKTL